MSDHTGIEWTDATWNPLRGCSSVSEGCRNCYAEKVAARFNGPSQIYEGLTNRHRKWNGRIRLVPEKLDEPLRWKRPRRIFVNSMSDLFHEKVPVDFIDSVFAVMALAPQHTFQVLTKRPERMLKYLTDEALTSSHGRLCAGVVERIATAMYDFNPNAADVAWPLPNVWLGVSAEDQATADERIPLLLKTPAAVRWISAEPLLGAIDLHFRRGYPMVEHFLNWVVAGGESGPNARPMHPAWARSLRDQCVVAGVPFFFKQWGEWAPYDRSRVDSAMLAAPGAFDTSMRRVGKKAAGRELDGRTWDEYPRART